jgi:hypothetical protein
MKQLDPEFREALSADIDVDGSVVIGGVAFSPVQILERDQDSYREAFLGWIDGDWVPIREERLSDILADGTNKQRFDELLNTIKGGRVVPFIGSGMSAPSKMPLWSDFLRSLCASSAFSSHELEAMLTSGEFEEAATALLAKMPKHLFDERLEETFRSRIENKIDGAVRFIPDIFTGTAITTNFDDVLETVYRAVETPYQEVLNGNSIAQFRKLRAKGFRCLLKIHGHYSNPEGRVLTRTEYDAAYGVGCAARVELEYVFGSEPLLFMGCSLSNDRTVQLLKEIVDEDNGTPRNYAFMKRPNDGVTQLAREHFLSERKIFPVWYDGDHDESIEALLVGILRATGKL